MATPRATARWQESFENTGLFEPLVHSQFSHTQTLQSADFLAQVASWSWIANLEEEQRAAVLGDVEAVVKEHDELTIPYRTDLYLTRRTTPSRAS